MARSTRRIAAAVTGLVVIAGCGGSDGDKAGGSGAVEPVVLTIAQPGVGAPPPHLARWADEVGRRSDGTVRIEFAAEWRAGESDYEVRTIEDVRAGKVDIAWVGARVFDTIGVNDFQALVAPMLVDSHDLQDAVFDTAIPDRMLPGLKEVDLVGIGVLPGPMRKVLGVTRPFLTPADFAGAVVGMQDSRLTEQALLAVGATPRAVPAGVELDGLDAYEQQPGSIAGNHYARTARYVTANVNLWPRPLVIFMSTEAFDSLTSDQQAVLRETAAGAVDEALAESRADDVDGITSICGEGMSLAVATRDDLAELRTAFQPVYDELAANPNTKSYLDAITALKDELAFPPDSAACPAMDTASDAADAADSNGFPEGTFEMTQTPDDGGSCDEHTPAPFPALHRLTLSNGNVELLVQVDVDGTMEPGWIGTYTVFRDQVEFVDSVGAVNARWSFDGTNLNFTDVGPYCGDAVVWGTHPWVLSPPADESADEASIPDGTYEMTLTAEDWRDGCGAETGFELPDIPLEGVRHEVTFDAGSVELLVEVNGAMEPGYVGTYTVFRDRIELTDPAGTTSARWSFDGENLTFTDLADAPGCDDVVVWGSHPWVLTRAVDEP